MNHSPDSTRKQNQQRDKSENVSNNKLTSKCTKLLDIISKNSSCK